MFRCHVERILHAPNPPPSAGDAATHRCSHRTRRRVPFGVLLQRLLLRLLEWAVRRHAPTRIRAALPVRPAVPRRRWPPRLLTALVQPHARGASTTACERIPHPKKKTPQAVVSRRGLEAKAWWRCRESNPGPRSRAGRTSTRIVDALKAYAARLPVHEARAPQRLIGIRRLIRSRRTGRLHPFCRCLTLPKGQERRETDGGCYAAIAYE